MSQDDHATQIQGCIDRLRAGDARARDELLAHASDRPTRAAMASGAAAAGPDLGCRILGL
jgi:hypothetical protein